MAESPGGEAIDTPAEVRDEKIAELKAALAELENGEGLSRFLGGHGLMSRVFEFKWSEPALDVDFRLPYARVPSDEEAQKDDDAEIGAAIRMAILLLTVEGRKAESLEGLRVRVWADGDGVGYSMLDADGNTVDSAATIRRHSTMRVGEATTSSRLVGRSVWNDRWLLVVPASSLSSDRANAIKTFVNGLDSDSDGQVDISGVSDIRLGIRASSRSGN